MSKLLSKDEINKRLRSLEFNWQHTNNQLEIKIETSDFAEAIWLVNEVAQIAEELNHHPDFAIHDYNKVDLSTWTHNEEGTTAKDFELAERIEGVITRIK